MANFKRQKTRRRVRCTMCTPDRWKGNNKERHNINTQRKLAATGTELATLS